MNFIIGQELPEKKFYVNRQKLKDYADASGDQNPIHQDETFARAVGLPNVIAHGMYTMALAGEAVRLWVGNQRNILEFATRFTKPVVVPAESEVPIIFTGKVSEANASEITIEVTAISDGVKVLGQTKARIQL